MRWHYTLLLVCLLGWAAFAQAQNYTEVTDQPQVVQLCLITSTCLLPSCAVCNDTALSINLSFVKVGRLVTMQMPRFNLTFPPLGHVDSFRLPGAVPEGMRISEDWAPFVSQAVTIGCQNGDVYRTPGQLNTFTNGDIEVAKAEYNAYTRMWPISESICGTLTAVSFSWMT